MLNNVVAPMQRSRIRMPPDERRRQLVGLGLARLVEHPADELPLDAVARDAGISRSLLFHYFPTKADFHAEVVAAAGRRVIRNLTPAAGPSGVAGVRNLATRFVEQIERRRALYLALMRGAVPLTGGTAVPETVRAAVTDRVVGLLVVDPAQRPAVHAWTAYLEDLAVNRAGATDAVVDHAIAVLDATVGHPLALGPARRRS